MSREDAPDRRRVPRTPVTFEVDLRSGVRSQRLTTVDVSARGVFLRTAEPWALHTAVLARVHLPEGPPLEVAAVVVRTRSPAALRPGEAPGMGLQFVELPPADRERWAAACVAHAPASDRRHWPRRGARIRVELRAESASELLRLWTRNLSRGGVLLDTDAPFPAGEAVELVFTHPETGAHAVVFGRVVRRDPNDRGARLAIAFDAPDGASARRLCGDDTPG